MNTQYSLLEAQATSSVSASPFKQLRPPQMSPFNYNSHSSFKVHRSSNATPTLPNNNPLINNQGSIFPHNINNNHNINHNNPTNNLLNNYHNNGSVNSHIQSIPLTKRSHRKSKSSNREKSEDSLSPSSSYVKYISNFDPYANQQNFQSSYSGYPPPFSHPSNNSSHLNFGSNNIFGNNSFVPSNSQSFFYPSIPPNFPKNMNYESYEENSAQMMPNNMNNIESYEESTSLDKVKQKDQQQGIWQSKLQEPQDQQFSHFKNKNQILSSIHSSHKKNSPIVEEKCNSKLTTNASSQNSQEISTCKKKDIFQNRSSERMKEVSKKKEVTLQEMIDEKTCVSNNTRGRSLIQTHSKQSKSKYAPEPIEYIDSRESAYSLKVNDNSSSSRLRSDTKNIAEEASSKTTKKNLIQKMKQERQLILTSQSISKKKRKIDKEVLVENQLQINEVIKSEILMKREEDVPDKDEKKEKKKQEIYTQGIKIVPKNGGQQKNQQNKREGQKKRDKESMEEQEDVEEEEEEKKQKEGDNQSEKEEVDDEEMDQEEQEEQEEIGNEDKSNKENKERIEESEYIPAENNKSKKKNKINNKSNERKNKKKQIEDVLVDDKSLLNQRKMIQLQVLNLSQEQFQQKQKEEDEKFYKLVYKAEYVSRIYTLLGSKISMLIGQIKHQYSDAKVLQSLTYIQPQKSTMNNNNTENSKNLHLLQQQLKQISNINFPAFSKFQQQNQLSQQQIFKQTQQKKNLQNKQESFPLRKQSKDTRSKNKKSEKDSKK